MALAQIPNAYSCATDILIRGNSAGASHACLNHIRDLREHGVRSLFSVGAAITDAIRVAIMSCVDRQPAINAGRHLRDGAEIAEITHLVDLSDGSRGSRVAFAERHGLPLLVPAGSVVDDRTDQRHRAGERHNCQQWLMMLVPQHARHQQRHRQAKAQVVQPSIFYAQKRASIAACGESGQQNDRPVDRYGSSADTRKQRQPRHEIHRVLIPGSPNHRNPATTAKTTLHRHRKTFCVSVTGVGTSS
jgi:hypothetical protein